MNRKRCAVLIDGSNFYFKLKEYVGFSHKASVALVANCSESTLLKKEDLEPYIIKK